MSLNFRHPQYTLKLSDWQLMADSYDGERIIKENGTKYLPATSGQILDGMSNTNQDGYKAYNAYKTRAVYHNFIKKAVEQAVGVMHQKPPTIELPESMEAMREKSTMRGESLEQLLRRINEAQLVSGRLGLLLDFPQTPALDSELIPYISTYDASCIINWDEGTRISNELNNLNLVVLDESAYVRKIDFDWEKKTAYRVLVLGDPLESEPLGEGIYRFGIFQEQDQFLESSLETPSIRGKSIDEIPFVFVNSKDVTADPDNPPLLGLANLALAVYRGEADYRQALFMQGQDTLVIVGGTTNETERRIGAGASIQIPATPGADAKFIGVSSNGLAEMRTALENDKMKADSLGATILKTSNTQKESGEALGIRVAAETASMNQIVLSGANALERILKIGARWLGANPDEVKVIPNMDFISDQLGGKELLDLMSSKAMGAPLSIESVHNLMQEKGLTTLSFEEEMDIIANEIELSGTNEGGDPGTEEEDQ